MIDRALYITDTQALAFWFTINNTCQKIIRVLQQGLLFTKKGTLIKVKVSSSSIIHHEAAEVL